MREAQSVLSNAGIAAYIEHARFLGKMGRGAEPILIFLEEWPHVAQVVGEDALPDIMEFVRKMWKSPNSIAIAPFLQSLPVTARRLQTRELLRDYLAIALDLMEQTTGSIHGIHQTFPSPGLPEMFKQASALLGQLSLAGLRIGWTTAYCITKIIRTGRSTTSACNRRTAVRCCSASATVRC